MSGQDASQLSEPLLGGIPGAEPVVETENLGGFGIKSMLQNLRQMCRMFFTLLLNLLCSYGINATTISFAGHLGARQLAATALGTSLVGMMGKTIVYGMVGGLDTLASQAYGAGNVEVIGTHFRTAVVFLLVHAAPLCGLLSAAPLLLKREDADDDLGVMAGRYVQLMLPTLVFECFNRPLNSVLLAQRITSPQMTIQMIALVLHIGSNYALIHYLQFGYLGAALATCCTAASVTVMDVFYVLFAKMGMRVWNARSLLPTWEGLKALARLSYPACVMRCAESWGFTLMTIAAGKLPDHVTAVAAASVSFNIYGILYMGFAAFAMTTGTQVGNALGGGSARRARHAALTSLCTAPLMWLIVATLLIEPHTQRWLTLVFTDGQDEALAYHLRRMLMIVAVLEFFDGLQVVMTGVIQGAGKQKLGVLVNVFAFYVMAIPAALVLAFVLHWGVEGMYTGMMLGPAIQAAAYVSIISRLDWGQEAKRAAARAATLSAYTHARDEAQHQREQHQNQNQNQQH